MAPATYSPTRITSAPTSAPTGSPVSAPWTLRSRYNGSLCCDVHPADKNAYLHSCHGFESQQFYFELHTNNVSGKCLEKVSGGDNAHLVPCNDTSLQWFVFDGEQIRLLGEQNLCLDYAYASVGKNLRFFQCLNTSNQRFWFDGEFLKTCHDDLCADYHPGTHNFYMHPCHTGNNQHFFVALKSLAYPNLCLDYNLLNGNLYMYTCHLATNQQFWFQDESLRTRANSSMCAQHDSTSNDLRKTPCNDIPNQCFYFTPV
eukprot:CAMPEP_0170199828 /NCGR_PEP_ID=MMETSP0040_2-20121228/69547_1 /TAXON_ID=641309 /ORGANISM="Lotharella oceanica, Strain CCMP622" /LENGTH=257 /DNA_ID=CAMNT_0010449979 /DNA_START=303 /DNA_END=1076 /DNA_ORIENTATION=-